LYRCYYSSNTTPFWIRFKNRKLRNRYVHTSQYIRRKTLTTYGRPVRERFRPKLKPQEFRSTAGDTRFPTSSAKTRGGVRTCCCAGTIKRGGEGVVISRSVVRKSTPIACLLICQRVKYENVVSYPPPFGEVARWRVS